MNKNQPIFIISNEPWGDIWYSKQHYANELSKKGYTVFFVNAPSSWKFKDLFSFSIEQKKIKENLTVLEYRNFLPVRIIPSLIMRINDYINYYKFNRVFQIQESLMWSFDPLRFIYKPLSKNIIYHIADPYMSIDATKKFHPILEKKASKLVCTSPHYFNYFKKKGYTNILQIPHAISEEEYKIDLNEVSQIKKNYGKFILFVGTLNDDVDFSLIEKITKNINVNFILLGKDNEEKSIRKRVNFNGNLHYLGVVHAQKLKNYIAASEVCITVYKFNLDKGVGSRSPLKILNYLVQKKPIVTSIDSEIIELENKVIFKINNKEDFIYLLKEILEGNKKIDTESINNFLSKRTYPIFINNILGSSF
ncbi:glycosyltransferase [Flammeovirga aprica]|uniref:Glycosyltransferase family 1 protein n=1 Tax=Flammeovirga aprica JL-4 TaxID=694437 RepID=A0A7X9P255_9BACT|nr:glycosyltransferase [Flammeovirga aprica]NME68166.1 glycosyltransferase family 1 protein [Flammeovirga aprica JL-4]